MGSEMCIRDSHQGICFSRQGSLLETAAVLVESSPAGYLVSELKALVQVPVKDPLRQLVQTGRLYPIPLR